MEDVEKRNSEHPVNHYEGCGCGHHHHHEHKHDHIHEHDNGSCDCGCGHQHHRHHSDDAKTVSANVGGGIAWCKLTAHEGALVVSCALELENSTLSPACLAAALAGVAYDVEKLGGIVGHVKCAASNGEGTLHISVTQAGVDPTVMVNNLEVLDEDSEINIAVICFEVEHQELLDILLTRLERIF